MILNNKTSSLIQGSETKRRRSIGRRATLCQGHWQEDWQCRCKQKGRQLSTLSQPLWKLYSFTRFHFTSSHCCKKWCSHANISCSLILCWENVFKGEFNFSADVYRALDTSHHLTGFLVSHIQMRKVYQREVKSCLKSYIYLTFSIVSVSHYTTKQ